MSWFGFGGAKLVFFRGIPSRRTVGWVMGKDWWVKSGLRPSDLEVDAGFARCWVRVSDASGCTCAVSRRRRIFGLINRNIECRASCTAWLLRVSVVGLIDAHPVVEERRGDG